MQERIASEKVVFFNHLGVSLLDELVAGFHVYFRFLLPKVSLELFLVQVPARARGW